MRIMPYVFHFTTQVPGNLLIRSCPAGMLSMTKTVKMEDVLGNRQKNAIPLRVVHSVLKKTTVPSLLRGKLV